MKSLSRSGRVLAAACLAFLGACGGSGAPPTTGDPVITLAPVNGRVWTGNPAQPEAEAVAVPGDRIVAVGSTREIRERAGSAATIDLAARFVTPGFTEAHVHFLDGGFGLSSVQLRDAWSREEFVARVTAFAATVPA